eukprot:15472271-Alexandrium_andersonii.AAC.1
MRLRSSGGGGWTCGREGGGGSNLPGHRVRSVGWQLGGTDEAMSVGVLLNGWGEGCGRPVEWVGKRVWETC